MPFEIISIAKKYSGKFMYLFVTKFRDKNNKVQRWDWFHKKDPAFIFPITNSREVVLIKIWRVPLKRYVIELPAGGIEDGSTPLATAQRELQEEVGYKADQLIEVSPWPYRSGSSDNIAYGFIALDLRYVGEQPEAAEDIETIFVPVRDLPRFVARSKIMCGTEILHMHSLAKDLRLC